MEHDACRWGGLLAVMLLVTMVVACSGAVPIPTPSLPAGAPAPTVPPAVPKEGPVFRIDTPVLAGTAEVTGSGPANVPIRLVDVTEIGHELAATVIEVDGRFVFRLSEPLLAGHSVGLQIGDLEGTPFDYQDFLYSDSYYDRPYVGILFDMAPVVQR